VTAVATEDTQKLGHTTDPPVARFVELDCSGAAVERVGCRVDCCNSGTVRIRSTAGLQADDQADCAVDCIDEVAGGNGCSSAESGGTHQYSESKG